MCCHACGHQPCMSMTACQAAFALGLITKVQVKGSEFFLVSEVVKVQTSCCISIVSGPLGWQVQLPVLFRLLISAHGLVPGYTRLIRRSEVSSKEASLLVKHLRFSWRLHAKLCCHSVKSVWISNPWGHMHPCEPRGIWIHGARGSAHRPKWPYFYLLRLQVYNPSTRCLWQPPSELNLWLQPIRSTCNSP